MGATSRDPTVTSSSSNKVRTAPFSRGNVAMLKIRSSARILAGQAAVICCLALPWDDPFEQYFQRKDTVTLGAGDAKEVNSVTHVIDPWPRYVGNTRIPGNGERMAGAAARNQTGNNLPKT